MSARPTISVVIPVYNTAPFLSECLESVLEQTLAGLEVICVDDGSTDESPAILRRFAEKDPRVRVLRQARAGAGAARNAGFDEASGDYVLFLDSDDFIDATMLEAMHQACTRDAADLCVCGARLFDAPSGLSIPTDAALRTEFVPVQRPFSYRDLSDHVFAMTSPVAWNKMYRSAFVRERELRFQEIGRTNDYAFTRLALIEADRITVVDEPLVSYRVGTGSNVQSSNDDAPLEFLNALRQVKEALVTSGVFGEVERAFVNDALTICLYNLASLSTEAASSALSSALRESVFAELGIDGRERGFFFSEYYHDWYLRIRGSAPAH